VLFIDLFERGDENKVTAEKNVLKYVFMEKINSFV